MVLYLWLVDLQVYSAPKDFGVNESIKWINHDHSTTAHVNVFHFSDQLSSLFVNTHKMRTRVQYANAHLFQQTRHSHAFSPLRISNVQSLNVTVQRVGSNEVLFIYRCSGREPSSSSQYAVIHTYFPPTTHHLPTSSAAPSLAINPSFLNEKLSSLSGWSNDSE